MIAPAHALSFKRTGQLFLLLALCVAAFSSFRFIQLEIVPFYPLYMDQNGYLSAAYAYGDLAEKEGAGAVISAHLRHDATRLDFVPSLNSQMSLAASWIFSFFGQGRSQALAIHVGSWLLLLAALYWTVQKISRKPGYALAALGISLFLGMPHVGAGGMADFRMDFPAACWMGISLALWTLFLQQPKPSHAWLAAGATAVLLFFRIIAVVYLGLPMALLCLLVLYSFWKGKRKALRRAVFPLLALGAWALLLILWDWAFIKSYYFSSQLGSDVAARGADKTWNNLSAALSYYPLSLVQNHFGSKLLLFLAAASAISMGAYYFSSRKKTAFSRLPVRLSAFLFCLCAAFFPLLVLTANPHRTPQVAGISVAALLLALILLFMAFRPRQSGVSAKIIGSTIAFAGFCAWPIALAHSAPFQGAAREDALSLNQVFASVFGELDRDLSGKPYFAVYDFNEALIGYGIWFYGREQLHSKKKVSCVFPLQLQSMDAAAILERMKMAKVAVLPRDPDILKTRPFPISQSMYEHYPRIKEEINRLMAPRSSFTYEGVAYDIFVSQ